MHHELTGNEESVYRSKYQQLKLRVPDLVILQIYTLKTLNQYNKTVNVVHHCGS